MSNFYVLYLVELFVFFLLLDHPEHALGEQANVNGSYPCFLLQAEIENIEIYQNTI